MNHDNECDTVYEEFCTHVDKITLIGSQTFTDFSPKKDRLDQFFNKEFFSKLGATVRVILIICYGQADVEKGNEKHESLVAQRIICDHINHVGGVLIVNITKELISSVSSAFALYNECLKINMKRC